MADEKEQIQVVLKAVDEVTPAMNQITGKAQEPANRLTAIWQKAGTFIKGAIAGIIASAAGRWFEGAIEQSLEAQRSWSQLGNSLENVGINLDGVRPQIDAATASLQKMAAVDDDEVAGALGNLVTLSGNYQASLKNLPLVADVAAKKNISLAEASDIVGRAMAGQTKGLRQFGIDTKDAAQGIELLRQRVAGASAAELQTFGGQLKQLKVDYDQMRQAVGGVITGNDTLTGVLGGVGQAVQSVTRWIIENRRGLSELITTGLRFLDAVATPFKGWALILGTIVMPIVSKVFQGWELLLLEAGGGFELLAQRGKFAIGTLLADLGVFVERAGLLLNLFGVKAVEGWGDTLENLGNKLEVSAMASRNTINAQLADARAELIREQNEETNQYAISLQERLALRRTAAAQQKADEEAEATKRAEAADKELKAQGDRIQAFVKERELLTSEAGTAAQREVSEAHLREALMLERAISDELARGVKDLDRKVALEQQLNELHKVTDLRKAPAIAQVADANVVDERRRQTESQPKDRATDARKAPDLQGAPVEATASVLGSGRGAITPNVHAETAPTVDVKAPTQVEGFRDHVHEAFAAYRADLAASVDATETLGESIGDVAGGAIVNFASSWTSAFAAIRGGLPALGAAIAGTARKAVAESASARARHAFIEAGEAAAQGLSNPVMFIKAAKLFATGAAYQALAGALGSGGSGGTSAAGGTSNATAVANTSSALTAASKGTVTFNFEGGFLNLNDARQRQLFADALKEMADGRDVVINTGG
jgi:hypothetical protein